MFINKTDNQSASTKRHRVSQEPVVETTVTHFSNNSKFYSRRRFSSSYVYEIVVSRFGTLAFNATIVDVTFFSLNRKFFFLLTFV